MSPRQITVYSLCGEVLDNGTRTDPELTEELRDADDVARNRQDDRVHTSTTRREMHPSIGLDAGWWVLVEGTNLEAVRTAYEATAGSLVG
jgi:hypothetical protein